MKVEATVGLYGPGDLEEYQTFSIEGKQLREVIAKALHLSHAHFSSTINEIQVTIRKVGS